MRKRYWSVLAAATALAVMTGTAWATGTIASIVGPDGTINGCYRTDADKSGPKGELRLLAADEACRNNELAIQWNQEGAKGDPGDDGAEGDDGSSVTSTPLGSGDANCPNGGSSFTAVSGTTFACNGANGTAGSGGGLPLGFESGTPQSDFMSSGGIQVVGSITVSFSAIVTFTTSVSLFPEQDSSGNNLPDTVRCGLVSAANGTGIGRTILLGTSQPAIIPITVQGRAYAGEWNVTCQRVSLNGGYIVLPGGLTAIQVGP
jgi:hypothetical protein